MNQTRGAGRKPCDKGCGRMVNGRTEVCAFCVAGHSPPEAKPALHRIEYLVECAIELKRRRQQFEDALAPLQSNEPPRSLRGVA